MIFQISLKKEVGPIRLGETRKDVRRALNTKAEEFMKGSHDTITTDAFDELRIHVFYDQNDRCEAVELFEGSKVDVVFDDLSFFKMTPQELLAWFKHKDENLEVDAVGAISRKLGLGFYVDAGLDDPDGTVDSILVCGDNYWD